jgi:oxygen-independent coproporphyrinogen-3 oxidase
MAAGLYIHIPFCTSICPYCDFAVTIAGEDRRVGYLEALQREIEIAGDRGFEFDTVYLGGGTPSSLSPDQLEQIVGWVRSRLDLGDHPVWHIEANPEHVTAESASVWRELGFAFVSLGVQSFDDDALALLGRKHDASGARRAIEVLVDARLPTVSVDLVFGLPGQTRAEWRSQLELVLATGARHLSCYQLTLHDGTVFGRRRDRGEFVELDDDTQAELYLVTHEVLEAAGWAGYEVSNFAAAPEFRSAHNQKYWDHSPYIGLGPSAHSFDGRCRWWNRRKVRLWAAAVAGGASPVEGEERLTGDELFVEAVMLGLRTAAGLDLDELAHRFGRRARTLDAPAVDRWVSTGHLVRDETRLRPTPRGMALAEGIAVAILG